MTRGQGCDLAAVGSLAGPRRRGVERPAATQLCTLAWCPSGAVGKAWAQGWGFWLAIFLEGKNISEGLGSPGRHLWGPVEGSGGLGSVLLPLLGVRERKEGREACGP